jgi:hypothetical protein
MWHSSRGRLQWQCQHSTLVLSKQLNWEISDSYWYSMRINTQLPFVQVSPEKLPQCTWKYCLLQPEMINTITRRTVRSRTQAAWAPVRLHLSIPMCHVSNRPKSLTVLRIFEVWYKTGFDFQLYLLLTTMRNGRAKWNSITTLFTVSHKNTLRRWQICKMLLIITAGSSSPLAELFNRGKSSHVSMRQMLNNNLHSSHLDCKGQIYP